MSFTESDIVSKVEKLLAQAESTPFEEEAQAFVQKAQELISAYQIDEAMLNRKREVKVDPVCERIKLEAPFRNSKAMLVNEIAIYNDCKVVLHHSHSGERGYAAVSVVGMPSDVEFVKMLFVSLHLQLIGEMVRTPVTGTYFDYEEYREKKVHGKTFRKNFIDGFTATVGARLSLAKREAKAAKEAEMEEVEEQSSSLALALLDKSEQVQSSFKKFFPKLGTAKGYGPTKNGAGFSQGSAAGQRANLSGKSVGSQRSIGR